MSRRPGEACDLHVHSTCSDGTESPAEVVRLAAQVGLHSLALTDHDTLDGVEEARAEGERLGVRVVAGVELSVEHTGTFHMIGLGVDGTSPRLRAAVDLLAGGRPERNRRILGKLAELGHEIPEEEIVAEAGGDVVGRPHIAAVMLRHGVVRSLQAAFTEFLARGAPAYADRPRVTAAEGIEAIHAAGGVAVLCHPFTLGYGASPGAPGSEKLPEFLGGLRRAGLDAMEVVYGTYSPSQERWYAGLAERAGLLPSGGSDFHGRVKPHLRVGVGRGDLHVPVAWLDALLARAAGSSGGAG